MFYKSKLIFRKKLRKIIRKQPNTIRYLKNGTFKRHELFKSLRDKVYDELSGKKLPVDKRNLDKMIDQEIIKVLKGWKRRLGVYLGLLASIFCLFFIAALLSPETTSQPTSAAKEKVSGESQGDANKVKALITSSQLHIGKSEFTLAKQDLESALKIDSSSKDASMLLAQVQEKINGKNKKEEEKRKNEEFFNAGISYMNNGQYQKAINQLEMVSKDSNRYEEAQKNVGVIKTNQYIEQCKDISYKELKKSPDKYKRKNVHFFGKIYNIQEISGKTILSLSTANVDGEYGGDEAIILFPTRTKLTEGNYIDIYGKMMDNYQNGQQYISDYLNASRYSIYYDQRTFLDQAPVIEARIIKDSNKRIYGK
jgi:Tfp pilus assembly protein PilF